MMKNKGFTLVEVLTAVTIFSLIMAALFGFLSQTVKSQRETLVAQETVDNASYVLEYMSRALRMAKKDDVGGIDCLTENKVNYASTRDGRGIKFRNYKDECQEFFWLAEEGRLKEWKNSGGLITENYLTPPSLEITSFLIGPSQSWDQEDMEQAKATFFLEMSSLKVQTTVSQRNLDVKR